MRSCNYQVLGITHSCTCMCQCQYTWVISSIWKYFCAKREYNTWDTWQTPSGGLRTEVWVSKALSQNETPQWNDSDVSLHLQNPTPKPASIAHEKLRPGHFNLVWLVGSSTGTYVWVFCYCCCVFSSANHTSFHTSYLHMFMPGYNAKSEPCCWVHCSDTRPSELES